MTSRALARTLAALVACALFAVVGSTPAAAAEPDTTPPTAPGALVATEVLETSITLTWAASTDDVGVTGYTVTRFFTDMGFIHTTPTNSITITGLYPSRAYTFGVSARDAAGNVSYGPGSLRVITAPGDSTPPSAPGNVRATATTPTSVTLAWSPATDNVSVMTYEVFRVDGDTYTRVAVVAYYPPAITSATVGGLTAGTAYTFVVRATDEAGNAGPYSEPVTAATAPAISCRVTYALSAVWNNGFVAQIKLTHLGAQPLTEWRLSWVFAGDERVQSVFGGARLIGQSGATVTVGPPTWQRTLPAQGVADFGIVGSGAGHKAIPSAFTLDGRPCQNG